MTRRLRHDLVGVLSALVLDTTDVVTPLALLQDLSSYLTPCPQVPSCSS